MVIDDKLGIGAELEADMQRVVDTYECEWKKAVNDPETRKRFRHFVNSEARAMRTSSSWRNAARSGRPRSKNASESRIADPSRLPEKRP